MRIAPSDIEGHQCKEMELDWVRRVERVSELKQKILEGIKLNGLQIYAYREVESDSYRNKYREVTDEDINELANDIFNEIKEQPPLNQEQEDIFDWLRAYGDIDSGDKPFQTIYYMFDCIKTGRLDYSSLKSLEKLDLKQQAQVMQAFAIYVLEQLGQEEAKR